MNRENGFHFLEDTETPVRNLQRWLRALFKENGTPSEIFIDGIYGSETREAVREFQRENGLSPTGEVDLLTFNAIYEAYARLLKDKETLGYAPDFDSFRDKRITLGDEFDDVFVLQALLNTVALDDERYYVKPSGKYDTETQGSLNLFRRATGRQDGDYVDRDIWNDLVRVTRKPQYYT